MGALWHGPDLAVSAAAAREKRGLFVSREIRASNVCLRVKVTIPFL